MTETFETYDGLRLAYRLAGTGPYLLCQSGGPGRASAYLRDLAGLTEVRTLVLLDSRGTGASERPPAAAHLAWPYLVGDVEALREHLGVQSLDLFGHSAGTIVAQAYAAAHPSRVERLLLVTPSGRLQGSDYADVEGIVRSREAEHPDAVAAYFANDRGARSRPVLYGRWDDAIAAHANGADTEMSPVAERSFWPEPPPDTAAVVGALREVTAPVLVVAGDRDGATGVVSARCVAESFPDARLAVLPGVGHYPWVEAPAEFRALVRDFLAG